MNRIFHLILSALLFNSIQCNDEYVYNADVRISYRYFSAPITWFDAKLICQNDDSELAMPKNEAESSAILNVILQNPPPTGSESNPSYNYVTLNSHDLFNVNEYVTQDYHIQYFQHDWDVAQPELNKNEHCLYMHRNGKLHNHQCGQNFVFICQKEDKRYVTELNKNRALFPVDPTYVLEPASGKYFKLHMHLRTWAAARAVCHAEGGRLAVIESRAQELFMANMFNEARNLWPLSPIYAFLGLHDYYSIGRYFTVYDEDIASLAYEQWANGEPNHLVPDERCVSMDKLGHLKDSPCSTPAQFFCERK